MQSLFIYIFIILAHIVNCGYRWDTFLDKNYDRERRFINRTETCSKWSMIYCFLIHKKRFKIWNFIATNRVFEINSLLSFHPASTYWETYETFLILYQNMLNYKLNWNVWLLEVYLITPTNISNLTHGYCYIHPKICLLQYYFLFLELF